MTDSGKAAFTASVIHREGARVVQVSGELDAASAPILADQLRDAPGEPTQLIVVDLTGVTFLDSTGLGVLIEHHERLRGENDTAILRLVIAEPTVLKVFAVTGLDSVFSIYSTLDAAVSVNS